MNISAVVTSFDLESPAQQLVDRFLLGYPFGGDFHPPTIRVDRLFLAASTPPESTREALERRQRDHGLKTAKSLAESLAGAPAVLLVAEAPASARYVALVTDVVRSVDPGCRVFLWGGLPVGETVARAVLDVVRARELQLFCTTFFPMTWRLPSIDVSLNADLQAALMLAVGDPQEAFLHGLDALLPLIERRRGGESGVRSAVVLQGDEVWQAVDRGEWLSRLLAAAVSRSDTPLGDPERDARTQDLFGLGLLPRLVREPRLLRLDHADGLRTAVFLVNGAVRDFNCALLHRDGSVQSAQIYRPPSPNAHHYSVLATAIEAFFLTGSAPHRVERNLLAASLLAALDAEARRLGPIEIRYRCEGPSEFTLGRG